MRARIPLFFFPLIEKIKELSPLPPPKLLIDVGEVSPFFLSDQIFSFGTRPSEGNDTA